MKIAYAAILALCLLSAPLAASACSSLDKCLAAIETTAQPGNGITMVEQELSSKVSAYKEKAIPGLLKYLKHENEDVRDLAGYIISGIDGITEEHLPALMEAERNGTGWVMRAIAKIGTDEALKFIMKEMEREKHTGGIGAVALEIAGNKAVPYMLKHFQCQDNCDMLLLDALASVMIEMGDGASEAIPELTRIALSPNSNELARNEAERVLVKTGAPGAVDIAIKRLEEITGDDFWAIRMTQWRIFDIAALGKDASKAGPLIVKRLNSKDRDLRQAAIRAIGFIDYKEASPELIKLLDSEDWLTVYVAAESLGMLSEQSALERLAQVSDGHWYPPVREAAAKAIRAIKGEDAYEVDSRNSEFRFGSYGDAGYEIKPCNKSDYENIATGGGYKDFIGSMEVNDNFKYKIKTYNDPDEDGTKLMMPQLGVRVDNGWIVGCDRGEWGGELVHWVSSDEYYILAYENIADIFVTPYGTFAVGGLVHLGLNYGMIYKITDTGGGRYAADIVAHLPAASHSNVMLKDGRLLLNSFRGSVIFTPNEGLTMAECAK